MELYWSLRDIPELENLDKGEQTEVWAATLGQRLRDPFLLLLIIPFILIVFLGNFLGDWLLPFSYGSSVGGGLGGGLGVYLFLVVSFHRARPFLAEEIRRRSL